MDVPKDQFQYMAQIDAFNQSQLEISDSLESVYAHRTEQGRHYSYMQRDTNPRFKSYEKKTLYEIVKIDLNHCDTNDVMTIPQFGSKRSTKMLEYRNRLGGFYSLEQLQEVYVLQNIDLKFLDTYFYVNKSDVKKINVNTASYKEMVSHPYFDAYLAKTIINHRNKKGKISSLGEFQQITHAYPELMEKIQYYICF